MTQKQLICPERLRQIPKQFSWIDQRLIRDRHISKLNPHAQGLYLFLVTAADAQGLSYYGDRSVCGCLRFSAMQLAQARQQLLDTGLIAYQKPIYQVLALQAASLPVATVRKPSQPCRLGDLFKNINQ